MKKEYQAPSIKITPLKPRRMLCASNLTISNTQTSTQWSREFDLENEVGE